MPNNVEKLDQSWSQLNNKASWLFTHIASTILDTKIPVTNGTKGQTTNLRTELAWLPDNFKALHALALRFRPGKSGAYHDGDLYGMLRRTESNTAVTAQLVSALKAVAGGESFDEAKLLAGIDHTVRTAIAEGVVKVDVTVEGAK
ncbi:hypothetical protein ABIB35_003107 [Arthrobacter sp. UYP6]|uniref:hypothetical protein n=1 Tax=Arthrobacter sp. UYP6 TaxID=1756378 RepID=UPI0033995DBD